MQIKRYPPTKNKSLRAWSAADEYLLRYIDEQGIKMGQSLIYHDRFGYLSCHLQSAAPIVVVNYKSQEKAIRLNFERNKLDEEKITLKTALSQIETLVDVVLMRIPKSLDLLQLYFQQMSQALHAKSVVIAGFMTKYFSPKILSIAALYFEEVNQSKAWKKSRLLLLGKPKPFEERSLINEVSWEQFSLKQYFGVFSANQLDIGTRFLLEHLELPSLENPRMLDLASGNGILALALRKHFPSAPLLLVDDSYLAISSAKINLGKKNCQFYYDDRLDEIESNSVDFVISNPPFHFEYETNIEVSLNLFKDVQRVLKKGGKFQLVANKHLNYQTHLVQLFERSVIVAENTKFVIYLCTKS